MIESRKDNPKIYGSGVRLPVPHQLTGFTIPQLAEILNEAQEKKEMNEAVLLSTDDWEMLYINGKIVDEGHTLNEGESRIKYMLNLSNVHNFDLSEMKEITMEDEDAKELEEYGSSKTYLDEYKGKYA